MISFYYYLVRDYRTKEALAIGTCSGGVATLSGMCIDWISQAEYETYKVMELRTILVLTRYELLPSQIKSNSRSDRHSRICVVVIL